jgi:hypothetical protein
LPAAAAPAAADSHLSGREQIGSSLPIVEACLNDIKQDLFCSEDLHTVYIET